MAEVKVFFDREGNTLTVWFGNPQDEYVCEETGEEIILMKNKAGNVIGSTFALFTKYSNNGRNNLFTGNFAL